MMKHKQPVFDVVAALRLLGMKVVSIGDKVITIDKPSDEFKRTAVEMVERFQGIRRNLYAKQFNGFTVIWNSQY